MYGIAFTGQGHTAANLRPHSSPMNIHQCVEYLFVKWRWSFCDGRKAKYFNQSRLNGDCSRHWQFSFQSSSQVTQVRPADCAVNQFPVQIYMFFIQPISRLQHVHESPTNRRPRRGARSSSPPPSLSLIIQFRNILRESRERYEFPSTVIIVFIGGILILLALTGTCALIKGRPVRVIKPNESPSPGVKCP